MLAWQKSLASRSDLHGFGTLLKEMRVIFQLQGFDVQAVRERSYQAEGELLEQVRVSTKPHVQSCDFQVGKSIKNSFFCSFSSLRDLSLSGPGNVEWTRNDKVALILYKICAAKKL